MEEQCQVCLAKEIYEKLVVLGVEQEYAFHLAVTQLVSEILEEAIEEAYEAGYEDGYKEASADIAEIVGTYAQNVLEDEE